MTYDGLPPYLNAALLLDLDGTLIDIAPTPDSVFVPAGLTDTLTGKGPFTVFAPTDEGFEKLSRGALEALIKDTAKLKAVLSYHVIKGHVLAKDSKSGEVMTLQGSPLTISVSPSGVEVNGVRLKQVGLGPRPFVDRTVYLVGRNVHDA